MPYAIIHNVSGGEGNVVASVVPYKNYADMEPRKPSFMDVMTKVMGEDETKAFHEHWGSTFKTGKNVLLRYLPEASDYGDGK